MCSLDDIVPVYVFLRCCLKLGLHSVILNDYSTLDLRFAAAGASSHPIVVLCKVSAQHLVVHHPIVLTIRCSFCVCVRLWSVTKAQLLVSCLPPLINNFCRGSGKS